MLYIGILKSSYCKHIGYKTNNFVKENLKSTTHKYNQ